MLVFSDDVDMVYYVAYKAPKELTYRSQITRRLHKLDCKHIRRAFWKIEDNKINIVTRLLQKSNPIIMKRRRKLERPRITKDRKIQDLGSLIVIAYKSSKQERMRINRILRRTPYIRLCRGVYAFSHWHARFDKGRGLVDARIFWDFIREIDENAVAMPRLIIDNHESIEPILNETITRIKTEIDYIIKGHQRLYQKMTRGEENRRYILSTARKLKIRFVTIKKVYKFYEKWLRLNQSHLMIKPYPIIKKFQVLLNKKDEVVLLKEK